MYSQDTINSFIELRSEELSFRKIAERLKISVGLASKWAREHEAEIRQLTFVRREALRERYLNNYEAKLLDIADELKRIDQELKERDFQDVSTEFLLYRKTCLQARAEKSALQSPSESVPLPPVSEELNKTEQK